MPDHNPGLLMTVTALFSKQIPQTQHEVGGGGACWALRLPIHGQTPGDQEDRAGPRDSSLMTRVDVAPSPAGSDDVPSVLWDTVEDHRS